MTATASNGRLPRKQLGDQIDRLDSILDGLAEALNEAVADAAREGAKAAVKEILTEVLTNPQFAGLLRQPPVKAETTSNAGPITKSSMISRLKGLAKRTAQGVTGMAKTALAKVKYGTRKAVVRVQAAVKPVAGVLSLLRMTGGLKKAVWIAVGAGLALGLVSAVCPHWVSALVSAVGGALTALAMQVGMAAKFLFGRLRMS